jgi:hypothetical protein
MSILGAVLIGLGRLQEAERFIGHGRDSSCLSATVSMDAKCRVQLELPKWAIQDSKRATLLTP